MTYTPHPKLWEVNKVSVFIDAMGAASNASRDYQSHSRRPEPLPTADHPKSVRMTMLFSIALLGLALIGGLAAWGLQA